MVPALSAACNAEYPEWIGDGGCDPNDAYNNEACDWDGGDCCPDTCVSTTAFECGTVVYDCKDPSSNSPAPAPGSQLCQFGGDGYCDDGEPYNTELCSWDGGDCCEDTCVSSEYTCGIVGYNCMPIFTAAPTWAPTPAAVYTLSPTWAPRTATPAATEAPYTPGQGYCAGSYEECTSKFVLTYCCNAYLQCGLFCSDIEEECTQESCSYYSKEFCSRLGCFWIS
ncbi:unnamed protein product [Phaeothamnion confervicola]